MPPPGGIAGIAACFLGISARIGTHYRSNSAPNNITKQDRRRNAVLGKLQAAAGRLQRGALVGAQLGVTLDSRRSPLKAIKPNIVEEFAYYGIK
jgi:hypothetical protein